MRALRGMVALVVAAAALAGSGAAQGRPIAERVVHNTFGEVGGPLGAIAPAPGGGVFVATRIGNNQDQVAVFDAAGAARPGFPCSVIEGSCQAGAITTTPAGASFLVSVFPTDHGRDGHAPPGLARIARTPRGAWVTTFAHGVGESSVPYGIAGDAQGAVWLTEGGGLVDRYDPATGSLVPHPLARRNAGPSIIALGRDGAMWFTEVLANRIGRIATGLPEPIGIATDFRVPTPRAGLGGITPGPDGALWFTEARAGRIGRITTAGVVREYAVGRRGAAPRSIVAGDDGSLWFTDPGTDAIGRITTAGRVSEYALPAPPSGTRQKRAVPNAITSAGGRIWWSETAAVRVGSLDPLAPPRAVRSRAHERSRGRERSRARRR